MSFRGRLFIFFTIIVIVPMAAVAVVLFSITSDSETGKSDARIAQGLTTALAVYQADIDRAEPALTQVARDPQMSRALARGNPSAIRTRARQILRARPDIVSVSVYDTTGKRIGRSFPFARARLMAGSPATVRRPLRARSTSAW